MGQVIAIIPARSGSKSVQDKNIRLMNGKPLIAYSIEQALASPEIDRVIVSTDSPVYKAIAEEYGAEVPFLRPAKYAQDDTLDLDVFRHALHWLKENENYDVGTCVHLRPTHPIREVSDIDTMITILADNPNFDSVRSVSPAKQTPYKMWRFATPDSRKMDPILGGDMPEAYNAPRQSLPQIYMQNACIDVVRSKTILEKNSMSGDYIAGYRMKYDFDIDTEEDFLIAERAQLLLQAKKERRKLKICCDIDGVLASKTPQNDYRQATALQKNISIINGLYEAGHHIVLFTARGYKTGIDWRETTEEQMNNWGVKYHQLFFGKPDADFYVDDKLIDLNQFGYLLSGEWDER